MERGTSGQMNGARWRFGQNMVREPLCPSPTRRLEGPPTLCCRHWFCRRRCPTCFAGLPRAIVHAYRVERPYGRATGVDVHSWMSHQKQLDDRQRPSATIGSGHSRLYLAMSARLGWTPSSCWEPMWGKRECGSSAGSIVNQIGNPHDFFFLVVKPMLGFPEKR